MISFQPASITHHITEPKSHNYGLLLLQRKISIKPKQKKERLKKFKFLLPLKIFHAITGDTLLSEGRVIWDNELSLVMIHCKNGLC
jgi:hypothetical protein